MTSLLASWPFGKSVCQQVELLPNWQYYFILVRNSGILWWNSMIFRKYKLHKTRSGVMSKLSAMLAARWAANHLLCTLFTQNSHHNIWLTAYLQFLQRVADTGWSRRTQHNMFWKEQEFILESVVLLSASWNSHMSDLMSYLKWCQNSNLFNYNIKDI